MSEHTPGEIAYSAYQAALPERAYFPAPAWDSIRAPWHAAWEAAALAVLAQEDRRVQRQADTRALVEEARPFFAEAFAGVLAGIELRPDGCGLRVVALVTSDDLPRLERCLRTFVETWWLANCHRSPGLLVFDYETLPGRGDPHA